MKRPHISITPLEGVIQHYAWGGYDYIPSLLGQSPDGRPYAELWLGAHSKAPSLVSVHGGTTRLNDLIAQSPTILGEQVQQKFGSNLPFLLKVLDARDMLSIQVHPTKEQAEAGFQKEEQNGIPIDAPNRNYKDNNHKPEVHVALTDFWMLHSFRAEEEISHLFSAMPEFYPLEASFKNSGIEGLYKKIMQAPQAEIDAILEPLIGRLENEKPQDMDSPDFWALKAAVTFSLPGGHRDRGIFSVYLLNLLHLNPGEGTFQDAGELHAYLFGTNIELMANSDNVLRGGLTPKHVDVEELLKTVKFRAGASKIFSGENKSEFERVYPTPAPDFELSRIEMKSKERYFIETVSAEIWIVLQGGITLQGEKTTLELTKGAAFFAAAQTQFTLHAHSDAVLFRALVPV